MEPTKATAKAATAAAMRVARAYDEGESAFRRLATAVMKHSVCKRAPWHATETLECLGVLDQHTGRGACAVRNGAKASGVTTHGEMVVQKLLPRNGPSG